MTKLEPSAGEIDAAAGDGARDRDVESVDLRSGLEAHDLVKQFRGRKVVDGVSVRIAPGEVVGLLGPNGAGKTTSFYLILGLILAGRASRKS